MKSRIAGFYLLFLLAFGLLFGRLFWLSVVRGEANRTKAEEQRIRIRKRVAPRGIIYDRNGKSLVRNLPIYKICSGNKESCDEISREEALRLESESLDADLEIEVGREYPYGEALAHVLGYLGEVTQQEIQNSKCPPEGRVGKSQDYELGDFIGRTGIEEAYDCWLRGEDGGDLIEVGAGEKVVRTVGKKEPVAGNDLHLSIDLDLQLTAFEALKERGKKSALVVATPQGEILALVSYPSFDPNLMIRARDLPAGKAGQESERIEEILNNPDQPFFNRAISGAYPPGSTFKIVTAAAGLEEGKIDASTQFEDLGEIVIGQYRYANWYFTQYGKTEGVIDLVRAIKRSTDTFFYKVGEEVGASKLITWGKAFGLGKVSGIDIGGEIAGFLPDPGAGDWFLGNTYHLSIGQGALGLTPLQINNMTGVIASGGRLCQPRLAQQTINNKKQSDCEDLELRKETLRLIQEGMREACSTGGTAFPFFDFEIKSLPANESQPEPYTDSIEKASAKTGRVACKTGTAEFGDPQDRTHAWLTAYAPAFAEASAGKPEIVVTAIIEAGGEGSYVAAPIVKEVMEEWFYR